MDRGGGKGGKAERERTVAETRPDGRGELQEDSEKRQREDSGIKVRDVEGE